ncbi:MAG: ParB/RepB/Spo0J family partition protein [Planctomycetota bacterium]
MAKIFNVSPAVISNALRLLTLPEQIKNYFSRENFTEGHARLILSIKDESKQIEYAKRVITENLSVRQLEDLILKDSQIKSKKILRKSTLPIELHEIQLKLTNKYNTKVKIQYNTNTHTGSIVLKFFDTKHLNEIIEKLLK